MLIAKSTDFILQHNEIIDDAGPIREPVSGEVMPRYRNVRDCCACTLLRVLCVETSVCLSLLFVVVLVGVNYPLIELWKAH